MSELEGVPTAPRQQQLEIAVRAFWHPAYDDYPVVGITWKQARAFCIWRTQLLNSYLNTNGETIVQDFRLPTESEWEYASRGGHDLAPYPWGGPYIRNSRGCFLGNFKPMRGNYMDDGGFYTVKSTSYWPNDYGLYCMSGNVSEWTSNAYDESAYNFTHDLNADYAYEAKDSDPVSLKRKVIRGGHGRMLDSIFKPEPVHTNTRILQKAMLDSDALCHFLAGIRQIFKRKLNHKHFSFNLK